MIIDFRYHVASIVAIFIALALGILIGSTLVGQDFLENITEEQQLWIGKLEQDYLNLKKETEIIKEELAQKNIQLSNYQNFATNIKPYLVDGKLMEKKFAIIELEQNNFSTDVVNTLEQAGAKIVSNTSLSLTEEVSANYDLNLLLENAAQLILNGTKTEVTDLMEENEILKSIGTYDELLDGVIIVTNSEKQGKNLQETQNFITNYLKDKVPLYLISCEKSISLNKKNNAGFSTLNYIDTIPGQVNLVLTIFENLNKSVLELNQ